MAVLALGACGTVQVPVGPHATDPVCAEIVQGAPPALLGLEQQPTSSQGTLAWGRGEEAIVLRCGVTVPGPTRESCTTITDARGTEVDWIVREDEETVLFTAYGRSPAIDISVPRASAGDQPSAAVIDLAPLIAQIPAERQCLGPEDV